jgi:hypothetical protein
MGDDGLDALIQPFLISKIQLPPIDTLILGILNIKPIQDMLRA